MMDYRYTREDGTKVPTSQMTDAELQECLAEGVQIDDSDGVEPSVENVMERLRIELVIRRLDRQ